jgi:hypothetical protein
MTIKATTPINASLLIPRSIMAASTEVSNTCFTVSIFLWRQHQSCFYLPLAESQWMIFFFTFNAVFESFDSLTKISANVTKFLVPLI